MKPDLSSEGFVHTLSAESYRPYSFRGEHPHDVDVWQRRFRARLRSIVGIDRIAQRPGCEPEPICLEQVEVDGYVREEWTIQTELGFRLPFYLLRPLDCDGPRPLVITTHGHNAGGNRPYAGICETEEERKAMEEGERDVAVQAVKQGYVAVAPEMRGMGRLTRRKDQERGLHKSCAWMQVRLIPFGRTLVGDRVWDVMRLIDYASTRPEVDAKRIAITGNSGGGKVAIYAPALDERIKVAVPSSHFGVYEFSIGSREHCPCNFEPGLLADAELYDVAGLIAPRPFMAVVGTEDHNHPLDGARMAIERVKAIYRAAGVEERCALAVPEGGHRYYKDVAWPFINRWL